MQISSSCTMVLQLLSARHNCATQALLLQVISCTGMGVVSSVCLGVGVVALLGSIAPFCIMVWVPH